MRTLTEQITFKVSRETLNALQERGRSQALDANPFARKLVEEGLDRDRSENLADELRELLAILRPLAERITANSESETRSDKTDLTSTHIEQLTEALSLGLSQIADDLARFQSDLVGKLQGVDALAAQLVELRVDLNKTFAALLHYQMGFPADEAQRWMDERLRATTR